MTLETSTDAELLRDKFTFETLYTHSATLTSWLHKQLVAVEAEIFKRKADKVDARRKSKKRDKRVP